MAKTKRAKVQDLPGLEDRAITVLENLAIDYAEIRDKRMALNEEEASLKEKVRDAMKKHNRTKYANGGVSIELKPPEGEDAVIVRVRKVKAASDGDEADA